MHLLDFILVFIFPLKNFLVVGDGRWSSFGQPRKCNLKKGNNFEKDANFVVLKKVTFTKKIYKKILMIVFRVDWEDY